jgi:hypothetical protein
MMSQGFSKRRFPEISSVQEADSISFASRYGPVTKGKKTDIVVP